MLKDPRSRYHLFVPPIIQCLIFGYAATYDLNNVPYAVLDQDRTAASHELLAGLDGSGVFTAWPISERAADIAGIHQRSARAAGRPDRSGFRAAAVAGQPADVQVIADGRNSNTAGMALGYVDTVVEAFNADWRAAHGRRRAAADRRCGPGTTRISKPAGT